MKTEQRVVVVRCADFQGDDAESINAAIAAAKILKETFDVGIEAAEKQKGRLTPEQKRRMDNMRVTVKVMKVMMEI